jgi:hypothetical protein
MAVKENAVALSRHCRFCCTAGLGEDVIVGSDKEGFPIKDNMHFISCCSLNIYENENGGES